VHQVEKLEQWMVTYNLGKIVKAEPELTPNEICKGMKGILRPYAHTFTVATTTLLIEPLFFHRLVSRKSCFLVDSFSLFHWQSDRWFRLVNDAHVSHSLGMLAALTLEAN
jgi:hypothetical protein